MHAHMGRQVSGGILLSQKIKNRKFNYYIYFTEQPVLFYAWRNYLKCWERPSETY
jgi:hypothetical protein